MSTATFPRPRPRPAPRPLDRRGVPPPSTRTLTGQLLADAHLLRTRGDKVSQLERLRVAALVLNEEARVVFGNEAALRLLGGGSGILGRLLGDGAAPLLAEVRRSGRPATADCRLPAGNAAQAPAVEVRLTMSPLEVEGRRWLLAVACDTGTETPRGGTLEQTFFHDLLNTLCALGGYLALASTLPAAEAATLMADTRRLALQAIEEVESQRELSAAERGDLEPLKRSLAVSDLLGDVVRTAEIGHPERVCAASSPCSVRTDPVLLRRVLVNLVRNAVEASREGEAVTVWFDPTEVAFHVHNPGVMAPAVQAQVFRRSFSTKGGPGRGVGTHSVRLFTERYLGGHVRFHSAPGWGTTFTIVLPAAALENEKVHPEQC